MANMNDEHGGPIFRYIDRAVRSHDQHEEITRRQAERDAHREPTWKILVGDHPSRAGYCQALLVAEDAGDPREPIELLSFPAAAAGE
jgi:hypothetical protein